MIGHTTPHLWGYVADSHKIGQKCPNIPQTFRGILWFRGASMKKYGKFAALITVVVGTIVWLAFTGGSQTQSYYKTVDELKAMVRRERLAATLSLLTS